MGNQPRDDYILGVDPAELQRLWSQHQAWAQEMRSLLGRAGLGPGMVVMDLGCGPGTTSIELARFVEPGGRVIAVDESPACIESLIQATQSQGVTSIEPRRVSVEDLGLEPESLDGVYGRWILAWLPDCAGVFQQVAQALRPGGVYVLQEYLNWSALTLLPRSSAFGAAINACMRSWKRGGGTINIAEEVPALAQEVGLELESFTINARSGSPGSSEWKWIGEFLTSYLARLVSLGIFEATEYEAFLFDWRAHEQRPDSIVVAPVVADIVLRKPR